MHTPRPRPNLDPDIVEGGAGGVDRSVRGGLFEVGWAIGLKYTDGFSRLWPSVWTVFAMVVSIVLLGLSLKTLPVGTAYAVWTGVGAIGTVILGIVLFSEPATAARLGCIALILAGIVGLKVVT